VPNSGPPHFGDPRAELDAALSACALADASHLSRLLAEGPDYLELLHRLSTGDVASLAPGQGRPTVLATPKGRIVERLFVHCLAPGRVLSVGGAGRGDAVIDHLARFTFAEKTGLSEITGDGFLFVIVGPRASEPVGALGAGVPERFAALPATVAGAEVHLLGHDGFAGDGFAVTGAAEAAAGVWEALAEVVRGAGGRPAGREPLEARRVLRGLPASGHELTEDYNPLEAGLWDAVSFDKGCYVGQEVVARLRTYDKVSRSIVGLEWPAGAAPAAQGARLLDEGRPVGEVTSVCSPEGREGAIGLAYLKRKAMRDNLELEVGQGPAARVVELPFRDRR
jgi:folate-binding protein YgfZ